MLHNANVSCSDPCSTPLLTPQCFGTTSRISQRISAAVAFLYLSPSSPPPPPSSDIKRTPSLQHTLAAARQQLLRPEHFVAKMLKTAAHRSSSSSSRSYCAPSSSQCSFSGRSVRAFPAQTGGRPGSRRLVVQAVRNSHDLATSIGQEQSLMGLQAALSAHSRAFEPQCHSCHG